MRSYQEVAIEDENTGLNAYLVVDASDRPMSFGGTRIDLSITRNMVADLADNMSLKLAGHGSPVGGAKAGLRASPDDPRLKQFLMQFAEGCREILSSTTILGKDMGAKQWMLDAIYTQLEMPQLGIGPKHYYSTKWPDQLSGLDGYITNMTGKGVYWSIEQALGGAVKGARVLIQGFGVVGSGVAWHLAQSGALIVGVSDRNKAIFNRGGLDLDRLIAATDDNGLLADLGLASSHVPVSRDELLAQSADVLVLAAGSYVVDVDLAAHIQAPLVVEAANLALTPAARQTLHRNGTRVVPDVVASSSSAALVGHQIACGNTLPPRELWANIENNIKHNTVEVERLSRQLDIDSKAAFRLLRRADSNLTAGNVRS